MTREEFKHKNIDIVAKLRRADRIDNLTQNLGIVLNEDGSVFDKKIKKQFRNIMDWSKEVINV